MTDLAYALPTSRPERIRFAAAILFGRRPGSLTEPEPGWQSKLARAMGLPDSTVRSSVQLEHPSPKFDKQLALLLSTRRRQMKDVDVPALGDLAEIFEKGWNDDE